MHSSRTLLEAHLQQTSLLTPQQVAQYIQLRGYGTTLVPTRHH